MICKSSILGPVLATALVGCGTADTTSSRIGSPSTKTDNPSALSPTSDGASPDNNGGLIPRTGGAAGSGAVGNLGPNVCASAMVHASRVTPTVQFVLDGSGSMNAKFGDGGSRWQVLRDTLVGQNGVVPRLESVVKFGMTIYSNNDPMKCPALSDVPAQLSNLMTMSNAFPATEPGGGTPTGEALQHVIDGLPDYGAMLDSVGTAPIIILATDGEPNGCASAAACDWTDWANCLNMLAGQLAAAPATYESTLAAVKAAKAKRIPVWVISLADGLNAIPELQKTANIGAGLADNASPGATIYSPKNPEELTATLTKLLGDVVTCEVQLAGTLAVSRACEGTVTMNGDKLACNTDQGWKAIDPKHIALQGEACERFKSDPTILLDARFPCDVVVPD